MAELIYPGWRVHVCIERESYINNREFFDALDIDKEILNAEPFCRMMLWRLRPAFDNQYDRIIVRDVDSLLHYRERQAVENWIPNGRCVHTIADSMSHTIPLMGGMIGVECVKFRNLIGCQTWEQMIGKASGINFEQKGSDQNFLQKSILPIVHNHMVEHYVEGMIHSCADFDQRGAVYHYIQDDVIQGIPESFRETNYMVSHIGQAGFAIEPVLKFIRENMKAERLEWWAKFDKQFPVVNYWTNDI